MPERDVIHPEAARAMRQAIAEARGCEVFFLGRPGPEHLVQEVEVLARGHDSAVPAVLRRVRVGETLLHNHPSGDLRPSEADLGVASRAGAMGAAFVIVDSQARRAYVVVEPAPKVEVARVEPEELAQALGPDGPIAARLEAYEDRPQQVTMASAVAAALNQERLAMIEAGTGTGKSLAYLLPAILFATRNRERVVVSTNTINLQEQLLGKDLPFLKDKLGIEFESVLLKGRGNYLCLRKAEFARRGQEELFEGDLRKDLEGVLAWAAVTRDGSRSDLAVPVNAEVWDAVASDADDCLRAKSPFFHACHYYNSRRRAAAADVVIVNHSLLMADLAARAATGDFTSTAVLPPYSRLILDEAHHLEDAASSYFGGGVSALGLLRALGRLRPERDEKKGLLVALAAKLKPGSALESRLGRVLEAQRALAEETRERFAIIAEGTLGYLGLEEPGGEELKVRLRRQVLEHPAFAEGVVPACLGLARSVNAFLEGLAQLVEGLRDLPAGDDDLESMLSRIGSVRIRLEGAAAALADLEDADRSGAEETCRWVEVRRPRRRTAGGAGTAGKAAPPEVRLMSAPLDVAGLLRQHLHERMKTVVLTSATLTVGGSFDHFRGRLGLAGGVEGRLETALLRSPFDFARQARVLIPRDMPEPQEPLFAEAVREAVLDAVSSSRGRAFVLFTAYGLLERTAKALAPRLADRGLVLLRQGQQARDQLLARFRREPGAVLFAVDSFWEGVDVAGDALSLVVLVRLPFRVPTEPLQAARVEALERQGRDPFLEYSVPQAVIKFRQGFGRLIRSRRDRGVVLVLDPRVLSKRYGRLFLDSLPGVPVEATTRAGTGAAVAAFLG